MYKNNAYEVPKHKNNANEVAKHKNNANMLSTRTMAEDDDKHKNNDRRRCEAQEQCK